MMNSKLFYCNFFRSEDDDVDGAAMSSNTIMRDVKGNDLIEELQVLEFDLSACFSIKDHFLKIF